jgi:rSAM/selenodomain-associated transferase 1
VHTVAVGIVCKTPAPGVSKTRLSPPLSSSDCALLSACFIRDLAQTIDSLSADGIAPYAVYTPPGSGEDLRRLLSPGYALLPQCDGELSIRLFAAVCDLLRVGHAGAILVNADSPTLPASILRAAAEAVRGRDVVVLSPALDGGYMLIGLSRPHQHVFADIPWSTPAVHRLTVQRAAAIGVPVVEVPGWYDVDDSRSLRLLEAELAGEPLPLAGPGLVGSPAPATRRFLQERRARAAADATG